MRISWHNNLTARPGFVLASSSSRRRSFLSRRRAVFFYPPYEQPVSAAVQCFPRDHELGDLDERAANVGANSQVVLPMAASQQFYRLTLP